MARFKTNPQTDKRGTKDGYRYYGHQHNGFLYAKLVGKWLYKRVVTVTGKVLNYKPTVANNQERKLFA